MINIFGIVFLVFMVDIHMFDKNQFGLEHFSTIVTFGHFLSSEAWNTYFQHWQSLISLQIYMYLGAQSDCEQIATLVSMLDIHMVGQNQSVLELFSTIVTFESFLLSEFKGLEH